MPGRSTRLVAMRRRNEAKRLRKEGLTYAAIALHLDVTAGAAYNLANGRRDPSKPKRRKTIPRDASLGAKLPLRSADPPHPDICSRCGQPGRRYICGKCKSVLTVAARQRREAKDPLYLKDRRKQRRDYSRRKRATL